MRPGYIHEALCYQSDEEFLSTVVPFVREGAESGEPVLVALGDSKAALVRSALPPSVHVEYASGADVYDRPAGMIRSYREYLTGWADKGATQIRLFGEMPAQAYGPTWDAWMRYEAAVNVAYGEFPLWAICAYDSRILPDEKLHDVARTHPFLVRPDGTRPANSAYAGPEKFLAGPHAAPPDPLEATHPRADLDAPTPAQARRAVRAADPGDLSEDAVSDLVLAVSEAVTNAATHGRTPIRLRLWSGGDRLLAAVSDAGPGPSDPYVGLLPVLGTTDGGRGLWIIQQACDHVVLRRGPEGWTLRLTVGRAV